MAVNDLLLKALHANTAVTPNSDWNSHFTNIFYYLFIIYIIIVLINSKKEPHIICFCLYICVQTHCVCSSRAALHYPDNWKLLSICWAIVVMLHCDWLRCFRVMRPVIRLAEKCIFVFINTPSNLCDCTWPFSTLRCWTKIAGVLWDTHTQSMYPRPTTLHWLLCLCN